MSSLIWEIYFLIARYGPCKKWLPVAFLLKNALLSFLYPINFRRPKESAAVGRSIGSKLATRIWSSCTEWKTIPSRNTPVWGYTGYTKKVLSNLSPRMNGSPYAVPPFRYMCKRPYVGRTQNQKKTTVYHQGQVRADTQQHTIQQLL